MEVFLGSLALGAAGAAAEGLYRRFKRRRISTTGVAALSGAEVQRLGAVEDGASTDGGASATGSDHPVRPALLAGASACTLSHTRMLPRMHSGHAGAMQAICKPHQWLLCPVALRCSQENRPTHP